MFQEEIELKGHIIDSMTLPRAFDVIMDMGGEFEVLELKIGKRKEDLSYARLSVIAERQELLDTILAELQKLGAVLSRVSNVLTERVTKNGVAPENFYSTTNHRTYIRVKNRWIEVKNPEMDCVIVVQDEKTAICKPIGDLKVGDLVVIGFDGIRVEPPERPRGTLGVFKFMSSSASPEKPKETLIKAVAKEIKEIKNQRGKIAIVGGPAIVHTGAHIALARMIKAGYVDAFLAGNAVAVHDIEYAIFGTSLGMDLKTGELVEHGHRNHLRAINKIRAAGSIENAINLGIVKEGIMYELIKNKIPFVLAGSIRDDGPLPEVITDVMVAQQKMRELLKDVDLVLMMASTLHSVAVGNLIPSFVKTICIDINPAVVTKLIDRGTAQTLGIVTDVGEFLPTLAKELELLKE